MLLYLRHKEDFNTLSVHLSGWPSGLRRQTQGQTLLAYCEFETSGPRMWAWVRIPPLTAILFFFFLIISLIMCNIIELANLFGLGGNIIINFET